MTIRTKVTHIKKFFIPASPILDKVFRQKRTDCSFKLSTGNKQLGEGRYSGRLRKVLSKHGYVSSKIKAQSLRNRSRVFGLDVKIERDIGKNDQTIEYRLTLFADSEQSINNQRNQFVDGFSEMFPAIKFYEQPIERIRDCEELKTEVRT